MFYKSSRYSQIKTLFADKIYKKMSNKLIYNECFRNGYFRQ